MKENIRKKRKEKGTEGKEKYLFKLAYLQQQGYQEC